MSDPLNYARPGTFRRRRGPDRLILLSLLLAVPSLFLISLFIPSFGRPREQSNQMKCASNLRQIGYAIQTYASGHGGKLPDDLITLIGSEDLPPAVFVCPSSPDIPAAGPTTQAVMNAMRQPGTVSYIYIGKGLTSSDLTADVVLAYEPLSNHGGTGMNVLFGDGHLEWLDGKLAQSVVSLGKSGQRPATLPFP